ncbi:MAG TPA: hypothetical protein DEB39_11595 [Planctomycetaceae bacterium]|nr:hypothetical protein [Planctomycetaceae bacterium]
MFESNHPERSEVSQPPPENRRIPYNRHIFYKHRVFRQRRGGAVFWVLTFLLVLGLVLGGGFFVRYRLGAAAKEAPPQMIAVKKELFVHEILERGSVESASNIEVRCEAESAAGLTIIFVVPEGEIVKKGDLLVELDSSTLNENVVKQRIAVNTSLAAKAQSEADLKTAELTLKEYEQGKFEELLKTVENKIATAKEEERVAADKVRFNQRLLQRNYITETEAEADFFALEKAKNAHDVAELEKYVLQEFTREKTIVQYKAAIDTAKAKLDTDTKSWILDVDRLEHLERQLLKCKIHAPQDGQVIYYLPRWGGEEDMIKEGKKVYERQIILRLPDPSQMQIKGLVNEANIRLVKVGQKAVVRLEAFANQEFTGDVRTVNDYPEPGSWMGGTMSKEYQTIIRILNPPIGIKPGLTAEADITVNEIPDALLLPVQAIFEYRKKAYCVTYENGRWDKKEVKVGPTNDKQIVILDGLEEGDQVVLGAWQHRDKLDLPKDAGKEDGERDEKPEENRLPGQSDAESPTQA